MSRKYKIKNPESPYFLTMTVVGWIDIFTRQKYRDILVENLRYCQANKGLIIYAYVIMSNHVHMIAEAKEGIYLGDIIRDLKKYTAVKILEDLNGKDSKESRKSWLLHLFKYFNRDKKRSNFKFWIHGNHYIELLGDKMVRQKLDYLHWNPVKAAIVDEPSDYVYSSARNYLLKEGIINVELLDL